MEISTPRSRFLPGLLMAASILLLIAGGCQSSAAGAGSGSATAVDESVDWQGLVPNARQPADGVVSGGQPTADQLAAAQEAGFQTVINLRTEGEPGARQAEVEAFGLSYVELPIAGAAGLTRDNVEALAEILEEVQKPALLHCGSGNRIGALFALKAFWLDGEAPEAALEKGLDSGLTRLEPKVRELLGLPAGE
ncbi:MAG: sulfur transferase domain-containing protein [Acidobacteriota bacterium]